VCSRYVPLSGNVWAPFDKVGTNATSGMAGDAIPFTWPVVDYATWAAPAPGANRPDPPAIPGSTWNPAQLGGWNPTVFGWWDPVGWFTGPWDGNGGPQGA
jgi:hypothetical protein